MIPLVLVHGFMGGSAQWNQQVADLSAYGPIIAVDLPGFGRNAHLSSISTIGGFAEWVIANLRARGVEKYNLLGHSMGGMIVQEMAHRDPQWIDKLVLYSTGAIGILPGRFETIAQSKARAASDGTKQTARRIAATWFLNGSNAANYEACKTIAERTSETALPAGLDAMQGWSGVDNLPSIAHETLVIWGDKDRTYPWSQIELLWGTIPNSHLAVIPGCAHAVHLEKGKIFNSILADFLYGSTKKPTRIKIET